MVVVDLNYFHSQKEEGGKMLKKKVPSFKSFQVRVITMDAELEFDLQVLES